MGVICRSQALAAERRREELGCFLLLPAEIYCVSYTTAVGMFSTNC